MLSLGGKEKCAGTSAGLVRSEPLPRCVSSRANRIKSNTQTSLFWNYYPGQEIKTSCMFSPRHSLDSCLVVKYNNEVAYADVPTLRTYRCTRWQFFIYCLKLSAHSSPTLYWLIGLGLSWQWTRALAGVNPVRPFSPAASHFCIQLGTIFKNTNIICDLQKIFWFQVIVTVLNRRWFLLMISRGSKIKCWHLCITLNRLIKKQRLSKKENLFML